MFGMPLAQTQRQRRLTEGGGGREPPSLRDIKWKYSHRLRFLGKEIHKNYVNVFLQQELNQKLLFFSRRNETQMFKAAVGNSVLKSFFFKIVFVSCPLKSRQQSKYKMIWSPSSLAATGL